MEERGEIGGEGGASHFSTENFIFRAAESILGTAVDEIGRASHSSNPNLMSDTFYSDISVTVKLLAGFFCGEVRVTLPYNDTFLLSQGLSL